MSSPDTGQAAQVRKYLKQIDGPFAAYQVARVLGIQAKSFHWIIQRMQERGEIARVCRGWFQYVGVRLNPRPAPMRERLARAIYVRGYFTSRDIAVLADTTMDTAQKNIRLFLRLDRIERTGTRRNMRGQVERIFKARDRNSFFKQEIGCHG